VDTDDEESILRKGVHVDPQHKSRRQFSKQFKTETVGLIRTSGKSVPQVCRDLVNGTLLALRRTCASRLIA
jgi:transposase-like protein